MRTLGKIIVVIALVIGGGLAWYRLAYPTYAYRYRMTVEVLVDGVARSGSSVIEVQLVKQPPIITTSPPVFPKVLGEAVFVDLGTGRNVIALLASGPNGSDVDYPSYVVATHFKLSYDDKDLVKFPKLQGSWELPVEERPTFVTFADLNDPKSARVLRPEEFGQLLGHDVRFKQVSIEITSDPETREIAKILPWLKSHKGYFGGPFDPTWSRPTRNLTGVEFIRGM